MLKKRVLLLLLVSTLNIYAVEGSDNGFNIDLTIVPIIEEGALPRGATIRWINHITHSIYLGASLRMMNKAYTNLAGIVGNDINITDNLSVPINLGVGLKIKDLKLSQDNSEWLSPLIHCLAGLQWQFDINWLYTLYGTYNYNFTESENIHKFFISIGIMYIF